MRTREEVQADIAKHSERITEGGRAVAKAHGLKEEHGAELLSGFVFVVRKIREFSTDAAEELGLPQAFILGATMAAMGHKAPTCASVKRRPRRP